MYKRRSFSAVDSKLHISRSRKNQSLSARYRESACSSLIGWAKSEQNYTSQSMAVIAQGQLGIWDRNHIAGFHRPSLHISQRLLSASRPPLRSIIKDLDVVVMNRQRFHVTFKGIEYIWEEEMRDGANLLGEIVPCRRCCQEGWWG